MKLTFLSIITLLSICSFTVNLFAIDAPIAPWEMHKMLGHGFDVSWVEFNKKMEGYGEDEVIAMKEAGFRTARIRTALPADDVLFIRLDRCIADCLKHGIIPIIAYNAKEYEEDPSEENLRKSMAWWSAVAERYRDHSHRLLFNLNIEWSGKTGKRPELINHFYEMVTPVVRKTNPTRIVIYSPARLSAPEYLKDMVIPSSAGEYVMAEWHLYAAGPSKDPDSKKYWSIGTDAQKSNISGKVECALQWQKRTGIPTWVGAWMAGNYNKGDQFTIEEQCAFAAFMKSVLDANSIPWVVNTLDKFYDYRENQWRTEMLPLLDILK